MGERVSLLARVEGEGCLDLTLDGDRVVAARLRIIEPPRFFEQMLVGRHVAEIPDLITRICGICPVAYQVTAAQAVEAALGIEVSDWTRRMRRLVYCGEWIESHSLYLHLLALPDVLGFPDAATLAQRHPDEARRGMDLFQLGNSLIRLLGGRSVHPVGVAVGGFRAAPRRADVDRTLAAVRVALPQTLDLVAWACELTSTGGMTLDVTTVALGAADGYPIETGRVGVCAAGDPAAVSWLDVAGFEQRVVETHEEDSTALWSWLDGAPYLVGPVARLNLNAGHLPPEITELLDRSGLRLPTHDLSHGVVARAIEIHLALAEAARLLETYSDPGDDSIDVDLGPVLAAAPGSVRVGHAATEAPRGMLWLRFDLDDAGRVHRSRIVPPTAQNQACLELHLRRSVEALGPHLPEPDLRRHCESVIRCYDPCISCATHLVEVRRHRLDGFEVRP